MWNSHLPSKNKDQYVTWYVKPQYIIIGWKTFQAGYQMTLPAQTTILKWIENFNILGNVEIKTGRWGPSFSEKMFHIYNSSYWQQANISPRTAVAISEKAYSTYRTFWKASSHVSVPDNNSTSDIATISCSNGCLFQSSMNNMPSDSAFLCPMVFVMNVCFPSQDLRTVRALLLGAQHICTGEHKAQERFNNMK